MFNKLLTVHLYKVIIVLLLIVSGVTAAFYFSSPDNSKLSLIFGGLCVSFFVAFIQFLFSYNEHAEIEAIKSLGIKKILPFRDDETFYRNLIKKSTKTIDVMGVTAHRFIQDFGDINSNRQEKKALLEALSRSVKVRILVPKKNHLCRKDDIDCFDTTAESFRKLKQTYGEFEFKYFDHIPTHSIVVIDDKCLLGPVFPSLASKDSPCIYITTSSAFAEPYLKYFDGEWKKAQ